MGLFPGYFVEVVFGAKNQGSIYHDRRGEGFFFEVGLENYLSSLWRNLDDVTDPVFGHTVESAVREHR